MEVADVYVSGVGLHLPRRMPVAEVAERGLADWRTIRRTGMRSVCVADRSGPEMAVEAAKEALRAADAAPADIGLVLHASTWFQGHDLWAPASYVQREAVGNNCLSMQVGQLSNGGMAALELAVPQLQAGSGPHSVLITTGDRFCLPGFDRWHTDPGTVCGDGGTAIVLSRAGGFARLRSLVTVSDPTLEGMGRGDDDFAPAPLGTRSPISVAASRDHLVREVGLTNLLERLQSGQRASFDRALDESGTKAAHVSWFVLPNLGRPKMDAQFFQVLDIEPERSTWSWGSQVGHLGAGDPFAGLAHLVRSRALSPGQFCVLASAGGGFAWSVAVLEIVEEPPASWHIGD
ncbi:ketoacyl-ACP synthase III family protein [Streptomyces sp. ISL-1]|uniref:ketoacyl-ACP synthase III family protein n=1 Tax=Streptomyces sp. ISL-1 TaxID=2817657 RepID=UPI0027E5B417|nr:ketoacyl-ACP synthase III family protein [Streptomyces sp. ISL-1]